MNVIPEHAVNTSIIEMGLIWHLPTLTTEDREKGDGAKHTLGDYEEKLVHFVLVSHKNAEPIICVNDSYDKNYTIKEGERILQQKRLPISIFYMNLEDMYHLANTSMLCCEDLRTRSDFIHFYKQHSREQQQH